MKIFIALIVSSLLMGSEMLTFPDPTTYEEALFMRRLSELWEDDERDVAIRQAISYVEDNPSTILSDSLRLFLADHFLQAKEYEKAEKYFRDIVDIDYYKKAFVRRMQCLQALQWYQVLVSECEEKIALFEEGSSLQQKAIQLLGDGFTQLAKRAPKNSPDQTDYANMAKSYYLMLDGSDLYAEVMHQLAYLHTLLQEPEEAAKIYNELANKSTKQREKLLYQAAQMQMQYDKELAAQTFGQICHLGGKKAANAALNRMLLLYELKKYSDIVLSKEQFLSFLDQEQSSYIHFIIGKSYLNLSDYDRAYPELKQCLQDNRYLDQSTFENACVSVLDCAQKLGDIEGFNDFLEKLISSQPDSPFLVRAKIAQAMIYKTKKNYSRAIMIFEELFATHPEVETHSLALFEFAHALFLTKNWDKSIDLLDKFLTLNPSDPTAFQFYIQANLQSYQETQNQETLELLTTRLEDALSDPFFPEEQAAEYKYTLAKCYYDQNEYGRAIQETECLLLTEGLPEELEYNILFLLTYANLSVENDQQFLLYGEKTVEKAPDHPHTGSLHLHLYNAYLDKEKLESAAEHLFYAFEKGKEIQNRNKLWLAHYYFEAIQLFRQTHPMKKISEDPEMLLLSDRVFSIWDNLLEQNPELLPSNEIFYEKDLFHLAELYEMRELYDEEIALLSRMLQAKESHPTEPWDLNDEVPFALAKAFWSKGKEIEAMDWFERICDNKRFHRYPQAYSGLQLAKIYITKQDDEDPQTRDKALSLLLDITNQKNCLNEPIHLEAAMEYVELSASFPNDPASAEQRLQLLSKTKTLFVEQDDIPSKDYHALKEEHPEKATIISAYIDLFDLEMIFCEYLLAIGNGEENRIEELQQEADKILSLWEDNPVHEAFHKRLEKSKKRWMELQELNASEGSI